MGQIRQGWMIIRDDEGHKFVECVTDNKEDLYRIWEQIKKDMESTYEYVTIKSDISETNDDGEILFKSTYNEYYNGYYYTVIQGAINIWACDKNFDKYAR